jgi:hypothetical protein
MRILLSVLLAVLGCQGHFSGGAEPPPDPGAPPDLGDASAGTDGGIGAPPTDADAGVDARASVLDAGAAPDAGVVTDPDATGCPTDPSVFFCDDFESGALPSAVYSRDLREDGAVDVAGDGLAVSGTHALRASIGTASATRAIVNVNDVLPVAGNRFFGRAWLYFSPSLPDVHSYLVEARGSLDGENVRYRLDSNAGRLNSRYMSPAADAIQHGGFKKLGDRATAETWTCIEWEYDGATNQMRYWLDGVENEAMRVTSSEDPPWIAPEFTAFSIGIHSFQATSAPVEVRWDDLALGTERIGCGLSP